MLVAIMCFDNDDSLDVRLGNRDEHLAYLKGKFGNILLGGPFMSDDGKIFT